MQTGKVRYVQKDLPLEAIHPQAMKAAEATHCAGDQGKYWEMHDRLFANQRELTPADLAKHAAALGQDANAFRTCLDGGRHANGVRQDFSEGQKAGVKGTPTFFLGVEEGPRLKVIKVIRGAVPVTAFKGTIDGALGAMK